MKLFLECLVPDRTRVLDLKVDKDKLHRMPIPTKHLMLRLDVSIWRA